MAEERLCTLLQAFADYYWSVPISYAICKISQWHPEVTDKQIKKNEDIPDRRKAMDEIFAQYGGREKVREQLVQSFGEAASKTKVGPNDPCSCGSGKKYKKCCGR